MDLIALSAVHLDGRITTPRTTRKLTLTIKGVEPERITHQPPLQTREGDRVTVDIPLPPAMIDDEVDQRRHQLEHQAEQYGMTLDDLFAADDTDAESWEEDARENATSSVKARLVLDRLAEQLEKAGFPTESIHGNKTQSARQSALGQFRNGRARVLVATDVAARGIDFPDIAWILQFDPPQDPEFFIHRVGRTARKGRKGKALLFLLEHENAFIEFLQGKSIDLMDFESSVEKNAVVAQNGENEDFQASKRLSGEEIGAEVRE